MTHLNSIGTAREHVQRRRFAVTQNAQGYWIARESRGLIEGVFVNQRDAIRFALFEAGGGLASVVAGGAASSPAHSAAA
jgi:hypothetical protein